LSLRFFTKDGLGGVYNKDGSEAMDWDEKDDNPYRTETLTYMGQWRARQSIFVPAIDDPVKVDVVMEELEQEIARSKKIYNVYTDEQKALFFVFDQLQISEGSASRKKSWNQSENRSELGKENERR
jgi:hypothetical protein